MRRGFPGKFESRNLSRGNLSSEIGRAQDDEVHHLITTTTTITITTTTTTNDNSNNDNDNNKLIIIRAQDDEVHHGISCAKCGMDPIKGPLLID